MIDGEFQRTRHALRRWPNDPTAVQRLLAERETKAKAALRYRRRRSYATGWSSW
jgi:hypothetical protein